MLKLYVHQEPLAIPPPEPAIPLPVTGYPETDMDNLPHCGVFLTNQECHVLRALRRVRENPRLELEIFFYIPHNHTWTGNVSDGEGDLNLYNVPLLDWRETELF